MAQYAVNDTKILKRPSNIKIHAQAERPPTPCISAIPRARIPPKAPARVAAEKNRAIRKPHSCRQYLFKHGSVRMGTYGQLQKSSKDFSPLGDVIVDTGVEATFKYTKKDSSSHEP